MVYKSEAEKLYLVAEAGNLAEDRKQNEIDAIARKLAQFYKHRHYANSDDVALGEPTEAELAALRHRSTEYAVLGEQRDKHVKRRGGDLKLVGFLLRTSYRLVILSAAIVILYQYFGSQNP
jgi:hypothetical protein